MNARWENWKRVAGGRFAVPALTGCLTRNNPSGEEDDQVEDRDEAAYFTQEIGSMGDVLMASALVKAGADSARGSEKVVDPLHFVDSCTCFVRKAEFTGVNGFERDRMDTVVLIEARHPVDAKRIYASGFSNGGEMVRRLWREDGDLFAAAASSAGFGIDTTAPTVLIPYFLTLGNLDDLVSDGTGMPVPMPMDSTLFQNAGLAAARDLILRHMGLTGTAPVTGTTAKTTTFHYSSPAVPGLEFNWMNVEAHARASPRPPPEGGDFD
jgi:hypothetical protein